MGKTKMTKKELFVKLSAVVENATIEETERELLHDFINHEITNLDNKSASRKPTAAQLKGNKVREHIEEALISDTDKKMTVGEIHKADTWFTDNDVSSQSITAQLTKWMGEPNSILRREMDKKKAVYFVIEG